MSPVEVTGYRLSTTGRVLCVLFAGTLAAVLATAATVTPDPRGYGTHQKLGLPPCGFHLMFNVPCPSCGSTTSFAHFVRGQWPSAVRANPAAFLLAATASISIPWLLAGAAIGRLWRIEDPFRVLAGLACAIVIVALLHWATRVPHFPWPFRK